MALFYFLLAMIIVLNEVTQRAKNSSKIYVAMLFSVFGFLMMFRSIYVGNDTYSYYGIFQIIANCNEIENIIDSLRYEKGFVYLCRFLSFISKDPQILFIVTGAFTAISFGRFIYKYSDMPWLSVLMFFTLQFYDLSLSGVRQIVSVSILLWSYDFLVERKFFRFALLVWVSSLFHASGIVFLLMYPLTTEKKGSIFYAMSVCVGGIVFICFDALLKLVGVVFPQYLKYLTGDGSSYSNTAKLASVLMLLLWLIIFIIAKGFDKKYPKEINEVNLTERRKIYINSVHEIAVWLGVIMLFLSLQGTILNRFKYVFATPIIAYYPNMLLNIKDETLKKIFVSVSCIVFLAYIMVIYEFRPEWQSSFPYTFFWQFDYY